MENEYKYRGNEKINLNKTITGILILINFLILSTGGYAVQISNVSSNSPVEYGSTLTITWATDTNATAYVYVGGILKDFKNYTGATAHSFNIGTSGMSVGTNSYGIKSCTYNNTEDTSDCDTESSTFTVQDTTPPSINTGPTTNPSTPDVTNEITILWGTNENATSTVHYQDNSGSWIINTNFQQTTSHSVNIGTHTKGTFKYWVESCDGSNNSANSGNKTVEVKFYNVSISSNATTGSGKPNDVLTFRIDVTNTGNLQETFNINVSYHDCPASLSASTLPIPPLEDGFSDLTIMLSSATSCKVNVTATSQKDTSVKAAVSISITISLGRSVDITALTDTNKNGKLGQNVTYTLRVTNIGNLNDRYGIYFYPTPSLLPVLSKKIVNCSSYGYSGCPPTGYEDVTVTVTLPSSGVLSGATYTANVTARSKDDSNVKDSILLTTTVGPSYNFSLSCSNPSSCNNSGGAGSVLVYRLGLNNLGNINDNYTLTATANGGMVSIINNVTVNAYSSQPISLNFSIPSGTPQGTMFAITVTATSQGNISVKIINLNANTTGVANGVITSFSAPANATIGDSISVNITFKNTGSVTVTAIPMVLVRDSSGNTVITINGSSQSQNISSNGTHTFSLSWTVANLTSGRYYWISPQVYYGGSEPAIYPPSEFYIFKPAELNVTPVNITRTISPNVTEDVAVTITNTGDFGVLSNVSAGIFNPSNLNVSITSTATFSSINPGETKTLNMTMRSGSAGTGNATLRISYITNGENRDIPVPFNINVVSRPILKLNPAEIIYINSAGTTSGALFAEVINTGDTSAYNVVAKVTGLSTVNMNVTCTSPIYRITSGSNKGNLTYTVNIPGTAQGTFTGYLEIEYTNNVSGGTKYTSVFEVTVIVTKNYSSTYVSPSSIDINRQGSSTPVDQRIRIFNDGNSPLTDILITYNVSGFVMTITPSSGISIPLGGSTDIKARITVPITQGTYSGSILINATNNVNLTRTIPVTVTSNHCGDSVCNYGETCDDCSMDCGICPDEGGRATHRLNLKRVKDYTAKLGETVKINITIENAGRRDEEKIKLFIEKCPTKWTCETLNDLKIKRAKLLTVSLKITVPTTAELKKYPLTVKVDGKDEDTKIFNIIVGSQCSKDTECKSSEYCNKNVCGPKKGIKESCTKSDGSECESGICSGGVCIECESESDCGSDEYCSYGECLSKKGTSESCNENYECVLGSCVNGKCIECSTNKDCGSGWYCDNGKCLKLKKLGESCTNNADCATERCKDNKCACVSDSHCSEGEYCDNGDCKTKIVEKLMFDITITPAGNITVGDNVTIRITSGGAPVSGAEVLVGGNIYTSNDNGEVVFPVNENGTLSVVVSKSGYNELSTELFVSEKKGFQLNLGAMLWGLLLLLVILVVIIVFLFSRKKGEEKEKSLQTLRGFRERFNYTSHEIKEKIKEMTSKEEKKEVTKEKEGETKKGTEEERMGGEVKEKERVREEVKEKPKGKPPEEDNELLSIEDITLPSIGEVAKDGKDKAAPERKQEEANPREEEKYETEKEVEIKEEKKEETEKKEQQKKEELEKKEQQKKEEESTPWGDLLKEK